MILGNHRDAWQYGGVDPSSGSASMMDLARSLGALARGGVRPKRSIVFASWDAEEFTLTSSTEWGEQFEATLKEKAIAYVNVDSSTSGPELHGGRGALAQPLHRGGGRHSEGPCHGRLAGGSQTSERGPAARLAAQRRRASTW